MLRDKTTAFLVGSLVAFIAMSSVLTFLYAPAAALTPNGWDFYKSDTLGFSVLYPPDYTLKESYSYEIAPERVAEGVAFGVSQNWAANTNFAGDSYISIESIPEFSSCHVGQYIYNAPIQDLIYSDEGVDYQIAQEVGMNGEDRFEETVFVRRDPGPCLAIRYFIHETGSASNADKARLLAEFDGIRRSLNR